MESDYFNKADTTMTAIRIGSIPALWIILVLNAIGAEPSANISRSVSPSEPAAEVAVQSVPCGCRPKVAFLYDHNTYDLQTGCFYRLLFDTPRALLFRHCGLYLSEDGQYFYYRDSKFAYDLAFGKEPANHFAGHAIWMRRFGSPNWQLQTSEAIMASPRN